jgi:hypothetical protein
MLQTSLRGAVAGALATPVMTLEQPLDKRLAALRLDGLSFDAIARTLNREGHLCRS